MFKISIDVAINNHRYSIGTIPFLNNHYSNGFLHSHMRIDYR
jgi:hypothetical protein